MGILLSKMCLPLLKEKTKRYSSVFKILFHYLQIVLFQVKVKVRVNIHGLFTVASASLTEKRETVEEESPPMEVDDKEKVKLILS